MQKASVCSKGVRKRHANMKARVISSPLKSKFAEGTRHVLLHKGSGLHWKCATYVWLWHAKHVKHVEQVENLNACIPPPLFSKMGCHAFYRSVGEGQIIRFLNMALLWEGSIFTEEGSRTFRENEKKYKISIKSNYSNVF